MSWEVILLDKSLGAYAASWDNLNRQLFDAHPFYASVFIDGLLRHFGNGQEFLCVHRSGENTVDGMLILSRRKYGIWSLFLPSQAQIAPLMVSNTADLSGLFKVLPGVVLEIEALNQDPLYSPLPNPAPDNLLLENHVTTISVSLAGEFDEYWCARSKNLRKNIKRYLRRIESEEKSLRMEVCESADCMEAALFRYAELESGGWKGDLGTAIGVGNTQGAFYLGVLQGFSGEGNARVYELYLDGQLIASRLCIANRQMLIIMKTAYDENYASYAPGRILLFHLLEMEFSLKRYRVIEFYTNATTDQLAWCTDRRNIKHALIFRSTVETKMYRLLRKLKSARRKGKLPALTNQAESPDRGAALIRRFHSMTELPAYFDGLFQRGNGLGFDQKKEWFQRLETTGFSERRPIHIYAMEEVATNKPLVILPMRETADHAGLSALSNYYTAQYFPLVSHEDCVEDLDKVFRFVRGEHRWHTLMLAPMPQELPVYEATYQALKMSGWVPFRYFCFGNWSLPVRHCCYDDYFGELPSALRNTIIRKRKRFFSREGGHLEIITGGERLEQAIAAYEAIYASSWKISEPSPEFISGLIRSSAQQGQLRLGLAYVNQQPASAQIWITDNGHASIYKLAYDEQFSRLSVGTILTDYLMRHAIDVDKVKYVDYLTGDDAYKKDWMSDRRERWGIVAYNPRTVRGVIGLLNEYLRRMGKHVIGGMHAGTQPGIRCNCRNGRSGR